MSSTRMPQFPGHVRALIQSLSSQKASLPSLAAQKYPRQRKSPCFALKCAPLSESSESESQHQPQKISLLTSPTQFYDTLLSSIATSKTRIILCSLYLGTATKEKELVDALLTQMRRESALHVYLYFDKNRATRDLQKHQSTLDLLAPLLREFYNRTFICLYETPLMRHQSLFLASLLPERVNEAIGVQHMKIYLFDDSVMLSGANLSDWYFENRVDRWMLIREEREIADFYERLCARVMTLGSSFQVLLEGGRTSEEQTPLTATAPAKFHFHYMQPQYEWHYNPARSEDTLDDTQHLLESRTRAGGIFTQNANVAQVGSLRTKWRILKAALFQEYHARRALEAFWENEVERHPLPLLDNDESLEQSDSNTSPSYDTLLLPTLQVGVFNFHNDRIITQHLLEHMNHVPRAILSSAYFNFTSYYTQSILTTRCRQVRIITSSPRANGFYGSKGSSRYIPNIYSLMERVLFEKILEYKRMDDISICEFHKGNGWTYHAKGLWLMEEEDRVPVSMIGSSNFGQRSVDRDVESQVVLMTTDPGLQEALYREQDAIAQLCTPIESVEEFKGEDRECGPMLTFMTKRVLKKFL